MNPVRATLLTLFILFGSFIIGPKPCLGNVLSAQEDEFFKRLQGLNLPIPHFYNESVRTQITTLLNKKSEASQWIAEGNFALEFLGPFFDSAQLPRELALLAVSNTRLKPQFVAPNTGASGIWPLTYSVAKRYRLITHSFVDQRRNIERSTQVMVQYVTDLENIYQDWHFTISAFFAGPINLNMAIRKSGNTLDYKAVHESLSIEHRQCLEHFMALTYLMHFYSEHQIVPGKYKPIETDTVCTSVGMSLAYVADKLELKKSELKSINPEFLEGLIPNIPDCMCFQLPTHVINRYRELRDSIEIKDTITAEAIQQGEVSPQSPTGIPRELPSSSQSVLIYYTIKSGDNLGLLSRIFDCQIRDIQKWNNMRNTMLYAGKKLKIYVPANKEATYRKINNMTMAQKQALARSK